MLNLIGRYFVVVALCCGVLVASSFLKIAHANVIIEHRYQGDEDPNGPGIQMLPPIDYTGSNPSNPCTAGPWPATNGILVWDGADPINCIPGSSGDVSGDVMFQGNIVSNAGNLTASQGSVSAYNGVAIGNVHPLPQNTSCAGTKPTTMSWMALPGDTSNHLYVCDGATMQWVDANPPVPQFPVHIASPVCTANGTLPYPNTQNLKNYPDHLCLYEDNGNQKWTHDTMTEMCKNLGYTTYVDQFVGNASCNNSCNNWIYDTSKNPPEWRGVGAGNGLSYISEITCE